MRLHDQGAFYRVTLSERDTYGWAHRIGAVWPCSTLSGKRASVTLDKRNGDLVDLTVNGRSDAEVDGTELGAMLSDLVTVKARARGWDCH